MVPYIVEKTVTMNEMFDKLLFFLSKFSFTFFILSWSDVPVQKL